jgi:lipoprotein-releasing system permease protein
MLLELRIGLRYLLSKRKEKFISIITGLAVTGIAMSVMVLIVVISVMSGFHQELKSKILGINAHISISNNEGIISDYESLIPKIMSSQYVVGISPYVAGQVITRINDRIVGVHLRGINPKFESSITDMQKYLKEGRLPENGHEVFIGRELARSHNIKIGDVIQIYSPTPIEDTSLRSLKAALAKITDAVVVGTFDSGMYEYDVSLIYVPLDFGQELFQLGTGVHGVNVKLKDADLAYLAKEELKNILSYPYIVRGWMDLNRRLFTALQTEKRVMFILLVLAVMVAATNIISTLIMMVMEKTKDIGILKSLGASNFSMAMVFVFLGFLIGFIGTLLGVAGGLSIVYKLENIEKWVSNVLGYKLFPSDIYYFEKIPALIDFFDVSLIAFCAIMLSILSALYPALRAARLNPVESIRYE